VVIAVVIAAADTVEQASLHLLSSFEDPWFSRITLDDRFPVPLLQRLLAAELRLISSLADCLSEKLPPENPE
jgi:hypothetical protein